jgi:hypothetical protein
MKFLAQSKLTTLTLLALISFSSITLAGTPKPNQMAQMGNTNNSTPQQSSLPFSDIEKNVYKSEIIRAWELKIIAGFPDGTFAPNKPVTREQAVSMIVDAISTMTPVDLNAQPTRPVRPFTDVPSDRWSAEKIAWAQWNIWPAGTPTGKFRPTDNITRSELVDFLRKSAEMLKVKAGRSPALTPTQQPIKFTDVSGYNQQLTLQMSAYCQIASPLNEKGKKFAPNQPVHRDYTAAAIIRTLNCVENDTK